jgi:AcrR family transcriptional regulator
MARVSDAHLEARRQSILTAATKVFSQKGIAAATMAEIASEAGISPGAIYRYFENKEQLAQGCMNESMDTIKQAWENPAALEMSFEELSRLTFASMDEPPDAVDTQMFLEQALIAVREGDDTAMSEFRLSHERVRDGIRFLMQRQYGSSMDGLDTDSLAEALVSFYWGARLLKLLMPDLAPAKQLDAVQSLIARALSSTK